jgi:hypothetical protein
MKIRIKGDSLRLRLSQSEVDEFQRQGRVEDRIHLTPGKAWTYALAKSNHESALGMEYESDTLTIEVNEREGVEWASSNRVSIEADVSVDGHSVRLLLEKDFACLQERPEEDESDMFPNPLAAEGKTC